MRVREADVAPMQVQGPRSRDVLRPLVGPVVDELRWYRLAHVEVDGRPAVLSRTGWSPELGFELLPRRSADALAVWDAVAAAGEPHGLLVTGPNVVRAVEGGITDTTWATGMGANALELDGGRLVDLDTGDFVGRDALRRLRESGGPRRTTVGLAGAGPPVPRLDQAWPVSRDGEPVGATRWAVWSERLGQNLAVALVDVGAAAPGTALALESPDGARPVEVVELPVPAAAAGARD